MNMEKKKINVLVVPSDRTGVSSFRSVGPHMKLQELYGDEFHIDIITAGTDNFNWDDEPYLKKFDIIHFHRTLPKIIDGRIHQVYFEELYPILDKLKKLNIITVMDLDDYWMPSTDHPAYTIITQDKLPMKIMDNVKRVDYVTTTTPIYAKEISRLNKNVFVLPNAIDPTEKQFQPQPTESERLRFGWLGGSSHYHDLKLMSSNVTRFLKEHKDDTQMVICGFDLRGNMTERNAETGQITTRKIKPMESVWVRFEEFFTSNYSLLDGDYLKNLRKYDQDVDNSFDSSNEIYRRVWTKPITSYASNYNLFDVSMAPINEHMFNKCKSQLKVIEAGFHKKALIAQDYGPYQIDCVNLLEYGGGVNEKGNAILIPSSKNHKQWYKAMKKLHDNPELVELLSHNLHETVKDKYSLDTVTKSRVEFYRQIVKDNKKEIEQLIEDTNAI